MVMVVKSMGYFGSVLEDYLIVMGGDFERRFFGEGVFE